MGHRRFWSALALYAAAFAHGLAVVSYPASATVLKAHALSDAAYGAIFLPQMLGTLLGSLYGARAASSSHARTLAVSLAAAFGAELLLLGIPDYGVVVALAGTSALGFGFGLAAAPLNALPGILFPKRQESALVLLHSVLACGFAVGPVLASAAIGAQLWAALPIGVAVLAAALGALSLMTLGRRGAPAERISAGSLEPIGSNAVRAMFLGSVVLYALAEGTFANWAVVYLREERGVPEAPAALALSMFWFALTVGRLAVSGLLRTLSAASIWRSLPIGMGVVFLVLPLVDSPLLGIVGFALAGLACSAFFPLSVSLGARHFAGGAARASSLLTAALMIGVGLGSFVIGPLRSELSISTLYRVSALYPAVAFVLCVCALGYGRVTRSQHALSD